MKGLYGTIFARLGATGICLASLGSWAATGHVHGPVALPDLPDAPEKAVVQKYCTACHEIGRLQRAGGSQAGWQDRIGRMQRWGSKIPPAQVADVARYLAAALPPRARPAESLTYFANLAVQEVREQDIQVTLRFAAHIVGPTQVLLNGLSSSEAKLLNAGQRARVFTPDSRGSGVPGTISTVKTGATPQAMLRTVRPIDTPDKLLLAEVIVNLGRGLAVANDAVLTEDRNAHVYIEGSTGQYELRAVHLGLSGDQSTEITAGLKAGDRVVTLGTFFVDAEQRLGRSN